MASGKINTAFWNKSLDAMEVVLQGMTSHALDISDPGTQQREALLKGLSRLNARINDARFKD